MKTVIYHSADFDGQFCREIARKFLGDENIPYVGWNFGDPPLSVPDGQIYILDLPVDRTFGFKDGLAGQDPKPREKLFERIIWIDHHKTSIETHPSTIPGYRIDGVAACRLAWQWFANNPMIEGETHGAPGLPEKKDFLDRNVEEPLAVRLAGEYDVWDKHWMATDDTILRFQYGMKSFAKPPWEDLLAFPGMPGRDSVYRVLEAGIYAQEYAQTMDAFWLTEAGHIIEWEGLKFLAKNTVERGSNMFRSKDVPATGHDALMAYGFRGKNWTVSLYHAKGREDLDLSGIAKKYGGGGHKGACGFQCDKLPFL